MKAQKRSRKGFRNSVLVCSMLCQNHSKNRSEAYLDQDGKSPFDLNKLEEAKTVEKFEFGTNAITTKLCPIILI